MDYSNQLDELILNQIAIVERLDNLTSGFQILLYIAVAFLLWQVIKILYQLFAHVFFGNV